MLWRNPQLIRFSGLAGIAFFGATSIYGVIKLCDNKIGLTLDANGIIDNTNASSIGLIKWSDIKKVETEKVQSSIFLLIFVKKPSKIIKKEKGFKRMLLASSMKRYGTPLSIVSSSLNCNFDELEKLVREGLDEYQKNAQFEKDVKPQL